MPDRGHHFHVVDTCTREFDYAATAHIRYLAARAFLIRDKTPARMIALVRAWRAWRQVRHEWATGTLNPPTST